MEVNPAAGAMAAAHVAIGTSVRETAIDRWAEAALALIQSASQAVDRSQKMSAALQACTLIGGEKPRARGLLVVLAIALAVSGAHTAAVESDGASTAAPSILTSAPLDAGRRFERIAFGSCFKPQSGRNAVWTRVLDTRPEAFLFIGDNVYQTVEDPSPALTGLHDAYRQLAGITEFAALREAIPVLPVWDDHDYGPNDAGADFEGRYASEALFEDAWGVPHDDARRGRDGIHFARTVGPKGQHVQMILLDTRFFRSALKPSPRRGEQGMERYVPDDDPKKTMLGEAQWTWLESTLREPAQVRLIASSVQVLADGHGWEGWFSLPAERERLFALLRNTAAQNVVLLSGDRHVGGLYRRDDVLGYPLWELTSSSLNAPIPARHQRKTLAEAGPHRVGALFGGANFGSIDIDWSAGELALKLHDAETGDVVRSARITLLSVGE